MEILISTFVTSVYSVIIIYGLEKLFKNKYTKYIPILLAIILGALSIIDVNNGSQGFKKVSYVLSAIVWVEIAIIMLLTAIVIDVRKNTNKS